MVKISFGLEITAHPTKNQTKKLTADYWFIILGKS